MGQTLSQLYTDLEDVRSKIREVIGTGAQYSLSGSHSVTQPGLTELRREEHRILRRIRIYKGRLNQSSVDTGSNTPDLDDYRSGDYYAES